MIRTYLLEAKTLRNLSRCMGLLALVAASATTVLFFSATAAFASGRGAAGQSQVDAAAQTIKITASDPDGTDTGTARLGVPVNFTSVVTGGPGVIRVWSVTGGGTIVAKLSGSVDAVYTPPATMTANGSVTVTARLQANAAVTTSYKMTLVNPYPVITASSPASVLPGITSTVTLTGSGFTPGTVLSAAGPASVTSSTYQSPTSIVAELKLPSTSVGTVALSGANPGPGGGTGAAFEEPVWTIGLTATDPDGTNTGTARLGIPVTMVATPNAGTQHKRVDWALTGGGKLTYVSNTEEIYTPPLLMPANAAVTITAYMDSDHPVTSSYTFSLINAVPVETGIAPTELLTGGTQTVALYGSGFAPGMKVLYKGIYYATTFTNYYAASVQLPVADNAAGNQDLVLANPAPGGGAGAQFTAPVEANSIALTAVDSDGTNTRTADVNGSVTMSASVTGSKQKEIVWSVTGAGSISSTGVYSAPTVMPENRSVTILAKLASNHAITNDYHLDVINPVPQIGNSDPFQVPSGATTTVSLSGSGFVPGTVLLMNGNTLTSTYNSPTSMTVKLPIGTGVTGVVTLEAQNPAPGGGTGPGFDQAIASVITATAAARILDQTTFGPTTSLISQVQNQGVTAWLADQFNMPASQLPTIPNNPEPSTCLNASFRCAQSEWWKVALTANDQLRQRVAFALSEIFVISGNSDAGFAITSYANMLANDAFANWYQIMNDVTVSPGMAAYLNFYNSAKPADGQIANENYARENMQLFNLGLELLNQDGSPLLADGVPQATYTQKQVQAFARAFTGWTYANSDGSAPGNFNNPPNYNYPLMPVASLHDETEKTLLNGGYLPSGQSAEADLQGALTNIFNHPNLPPFVSKQLIQHLVTGDPSPAYISRVAAVFIDNGNGVRGDMTSMLRAIFTDPEARAGDTAPTATGGHLREPILWLTAVMRGLGYVNVNTNDYYAHLNDFSGGLGEVPYGSPSVFNFFPPGYVIPAIQLPANTPPINSPEFALENTGSTIDRLSTADLLVTNQITGFNVDLSSTSPLGSLNSNPTALVNALNVLFMHNRMGASTQQVILDTITPLTGAGERVRVATYLVITSSPYKIMH